MQNRAYIPSWPHKMKWSSFTPFSKWSSMEVILLKLWFATCKGCQITQLPPFIPPYNSVACQYWYWAFSAKLCFWFYYSVLLLNVCISLPITLFKPLVRLVLRFGIHMYLIHNVTKILEIFGGPANILLSRVFGPLVLQEDHCCIMSLNRTLN